MLDISISKTSHLFHIVDQISEWSQFCHQQYRRYFESLCGGLDEKDISFLSKHIEIRKRHSWGQGLEQTFYSNFGLQEAFETGISLGYLSESEAQIEQQIFMHFSNRIKRLMDRELDTVRDFRDHILDLKEILTCFSKKISRFCLDITVRVPVFLIVNPHDSFCGGGYNGGRLTLEIPRKRNVFPLFLHELMHAFIKKHDGLLCEACRGVSGLNLETLSEGIAYALSPGIYHSGSQDSDPLSIQVQKDIDNGRTMDDSFVRFKRYGLALREDLKNAILVETQTLLTFLPNAIKEWTRLRS
jgi:hypothetical protein